MPNPAQHLLNAQAVEHPKPKKYLVLIGALLLFVFLIFLGSILLTRQGIPAISLFMRPNRALALVPQDATFLLDWTPQTARAQKFDDFCQNLAVARGAATTPCAAEQWLSFLPLPLPVDQFELKLIREVAWFSFPDHPQEAQVLILDYAYGLDRLLTRWEKERSWNRVQESEIGQFQAADTSIYYTYFDHLLVVTQNRNALERILLLRQGRAPSLRQAVPFQKLRRKLGWGSPLYVYRASSEGRSSLLGLEAIKDTGLTLKFYALNVPSPVSNSDPSWSRLIPQQPVAVLRVGQRENAEIKAGFWSSIVDSLNFEQWSTQLKQFELPNTEGLTTLLEGDFELIVTQNLGQQKETVLILESSPELQEKIAALGQDLELVAGQAYSREEKILLPDQTTSTEYIRDTAQSTGNRQEVAGIPVITLDLPGQTSRSFLYGVLDDKILLSNSKNAFAQVVTAFRTKDLPRPVPLLFNQIDQNHQWFYLDLEALPDLAALTPLQGLRRIQGVSRVEAEGEYAEIWVEL